jgi:hypothetical protein
LTCVITGVVVAAGYVATAVLTGLDQAAALPNAPGGLLQRAMIITGFGWVVLLAARLLHQRPAATTSARTRTGQR